MGYETGERIRAREEEEDKGNWHRPFFFRPCVHFFSRNTKI
jgi:hypothetical protein